MSDFPVSSEPTIDAPRFRTAEFLVTLFLHVLALGAVFTGVSWKGLLLFAVLYAVRMFGVTAGYHRYFAHRSYETGPVMRAVLAFLSLSTLQKRVTWWAAAHRDHHRHSDQPEDLHSPVQHGFWHSHFTWVFWTDAVEPDAHVRDLERMPEVVWLDRHWRAPFFLLCAAAWLVLGWEGVIVGVIWSTLAIYHATGAINSLAHVVGFRRYATTDRSRNNWLLALLTFGEGWHNNHHHYQRSARQGFFRREIDLTWYALKALEKVGLVWNLHVPSDAVRGEESARAA